MSVHSFHPDSHEHGLADGCPRCEEHAEHPIITLDRRNLARIMALALDNDGRWHASHADQVAAANVLTAMERAGKLAETDPLLFAEYLGRWGFKAAFVGTVES